MRFGIGLKPESATRQRGCQQHQAGIGAGEAVGDPEVCFGNARGHGTSSRANIRAALRRSVRGARIRRHHQSAAGRYSGGQHFRSCGLLPPGFVRSLGLLRPVWSCGLLGFVPGACPGVEPGRCAGRSERAASPSGYRPHCHPLRQCSPRCHLCCPRLPSSRNPGRERDRRTGLRSSHLARFPAEKSSSSWFATPSGHKPGTQELPPSGRYVLLLSAIVGRATATSKIRSQTLPLGSVHRNFPPAVGPWMAAHFLSLRVGPASLQSQQR